MTINTTFANGDKAWAIRGFKPELITIGQVRIKEALNGNRVEEYMAVETGVGSGIVYRVGDNIFAERDECERAIEQRKAKALKLRTQDAMEKILNSALRNIYEVMKGIREETEGQSEIELLAVQELLSLLEYQKRMLSNNLSEVRMFKYN